MYSSIPNCSRPMLIQNQTAARGRGGSTLRQLGGVAALEGILADVMGGEERVERVHDLPFDTLRKSLWRFFEAGV